MVGMTCLKGLLLHRRGRLVATTAGVAVAVALIASIGSFLSSTSSKMTGRAIQRVAVDWQVQTASGASPQTVLKTVRSRPDVQKGLPVGFAGASGFSATVGGSTQQTGAGRVLGLPPGYSTAFPGELRLLAGSLNGALIAQQTAANLHARPGDTIQILGNGGKPAKVKVAGVVDLPQADSLFQQVGAPPGAQAQAPPDNVVLLPAAQFAQVEKGAVVTTQVHVRLSHQLPGSPSAAFTKVAGAGKNLETHLAGAGLVGDNLGTTLDKARQDALYAQLLFLFLGIPGAVLAALMTAAIASAGATRRRREAALMRTRGASTRRLIGLASAEAAVAAVAGVALGLGAALLIGKLSFHSAGFGASTLAAILWAGGAALTGVFVAGLAIVIPGWRDARSLTVAGQRRALGRVERAPWWQRYGVNFIALGAAALVYWQASKNGYQLVLAPEGVPQVAVNWYALLAPVFGWIGLGLLAFRLAGLFLHRGRPLARRLIRPFAGELAPTVAATMDRQRGLLARSLALIALTAAFAGSTAVFNSTYNQQAAADARLTNGADVTAVTSPGAHAGAATAAQLSKLPGVGSVEPLQHRFAYVGADLQDLYGVRPQTIGSAGKLQNGWFQGGSASALMKRLATQPNGVLVAAETVKDFQLHPGDLINLRLLDGTTHKYKTVPFHYVGVAKEFPTAPTDSFLVANAGYVAKATADPSIGTYLIQTSGKSPGSVAQEVRHTLGTTALVTDIDHSRRIVGSNLTAVELSGLTRVELGFALVLALTASGIALGLGFRERQRAFAIARALGARGRHLGGFVWSEALFVTVGGLIVGTAAAAVVADMLVKVLTGVFDPPPDTFAAPWGYLAAFVAVTGAATALAGLATLRSLLRGSIEELRDL